MSEKKAYPFHDLFLKQAWSYPTGAVLLFVLALALAIVTGASWGVTGAFAMWGGKFLAMFGVDVDSWAIYNGSIGKFNIWMNQPSITNIGIILGAFISTLLAAQFKIKKIKSRKNVFAAILGGLCMGIGARLSLGCNIGGLFSGLPAFSLHGWIFWITLFLGAAVGSRLLKKYFM